MLCTILMLFCMERTVVVATNSFKLGSTLHVCGTEYLVEKTIGNGASGIVYQATSADATQSVVAIKRIELTPESEHRVRDEIDLMERAAGHRNIVQLYCSEKQESTMYLILEYCSQGDLASHIAKPMSEKQIQAYLQDLVKGFHHLYKRKILHRDLKPKNLFITSENVLKIGDFGAAVRLDHDEQLNDNTIAGTLYYLAPEVLTNDPYGYKSDLWSIAVCLYEMYAGVTPFERDPFTSRKAYESRRLIVNIWRSLSSIDQLLKKISNPHHEKIITDIFKYAQERPSIEKFILTLLPVK